MDHDMNGGNSSFWEVLGERPIGFTLVTALSADGPVGFIGLSVAHVSADPPLVSVAIDARNKVRGAIERSGGFAVNFLSANNESVGRGFLKKGACRSERFNPTDWTKFATGSPILLNALGVFDCEVVQHIDLEHTHLLVGRAVRSWSAGEGAPLIFFRGALGTLPIERQSSD